MPVSATPTVEPLLEALAGRIARRDLPPVVVYTDPFTPAQTLRRLADALAPLLRSNVRGCESRARMLYRFLQHETQTTADLGAATGLERVAVSRATTALEQAGLLVWARVGPRHVYRLSRWGEDWLLAVGRCEPPPERPA